MCTVCGCGEGEARIEGEEGVHRHEHEHSHGELSHSHPHSHDHGHDHEHGHDHAHAGEHTHDHPHSHGGVTHTHPHSHGHSHGHEHEHPHSHGDHTHTHPHSHAAGQEQEHSHHHGDLHFGLGPARAHAPGLTQERMVQIEENILGQNDAYAARNRRHLQDHGIFALNLVSSPGAGKTTLLVKTVELLKGMISMAVIEGDQQTSNDADRIRATGIQAVQINTGKGCHLDAHMVGHALERIHLRDGGLLLIENVGNLVCPAAFDLGEAHKVVILSATEGEDKPLKYPDMFHAADLMILNKTDLLPHLDFDVSRCVEYARRVNPEIEVIELSARNGVGMERWIAWLERGVSEARAEWERNVEALRRRNAELAAELAALKAKLPE